MERSAPEISERGAELTPVEVCGAGAELTPKNAGAERFFTPLRRIKYKVYFSLKMGRKGAV